MRRRKLILIFLLIFGAGNPKSLWANSAISNKIKSGIATFYTVESCQKEGTSGVYTASGEKYNESGMTCAIRSRAWGTYYKVTNISNGKSVICRLNDFGPGKKATNRGVIIDLTPAAFDELGGKRGKTWGEIKVTVEEVKK